MQNAKCKMQNADNPTTTTQRAKTLAPLRWAKTLSPLLRD